MDQPFKEPFKQQEDSHNYMNEASVAAHPQDDRRMSDEWDTSKVPPSRFQKRKGSIYATPSSRDGHVDKNYADKYHAKIAEKYGGK